MKIKESPKEVFVPSTVKPYVTAHEKAWEREMRHRLFLLEEWIDEHEKRITKIEKILRKHLNILSLGV